MSQGLSTYTSVGTGTKTTSTSSATINTTPHANTLAGDLVVVVAYVTGQDATATVDNADGWVFLARDYDSSNTYGIILAACIAPRPTQAGYSGIGLPGAGAYTAQCHTYRIVPPGKFNLASFSRDNGWSNLTASAIAAPAPAISPPYERVISLVARAYNNGAFSLICGTLPVHAERFDTGQISPPHGVVLNDSTGQIIGAVGENSVTSNLSGNATNRAGVRAMIPIVGNLAGRRNRMRRRTVA